MIKDIMNKKVIYCDINSSFKNAALLMKGNNIGFLPVKDGDKYVGVITDRDICLSLVNIDNTNKSIESYITNNIIYININCDIDTALKIMEKNKVKRLVVKEKNNTVGVLSLSDILNYTNDNDIINTYKSIFYIQNNNKYNSPEIDSFYL